MQTKEKYPTRDELLKEYEFCQSTAQSMETTIWQTSAAMGIGLIGTFLFIGTRSNEAQLSWQAATIIGVFSFFLSLLWWFIARRWWSIQHAMFMRMRHIEEDLGLHSLRYVRYLDEPCTASQSGLLDNYIKELEKRSNQRGFLGRREHQRKGVQSYLIYFPLLIFLSWAIYAIWLFTIQRI